MGEADGDSGQNKIEVPLYWLPRDLWGLLSSWWKLYNRGSHICTHPSSLKPISPSGALCLVPRFPGSGEGMGLVAGGAGVCDTACAAAHHILRQNCLQSTGIQTGFSLLLSITHRVELKGTSTLPSLGRSSRIQESFQLGGKGIWRPRLGLIPWCLPFSPQGVSGGRGLARRAKGNLLHLELAESKEEAGREQG